MIKSPVPYQFIFYLAVLREQFCLTNVTLARPGRRPLDPSSFSKKRAPCIR